MRAAREAGWQCPGRRVSPAGCPRGKGPWLEGQHSLGCIGELCYWNWAATGTTYPCFVDSVWSAHTVLETDAEGCSELSAAATPSGTRVVAAERRSSRTRAGAAGEEITGTRSTVSPVCYEEEGAWCPWLLTSFCRWCCVR